MSELLQHFFGFVCGQDPAHTWSPGGVWLPFCQRCTGLYVGACLAALLHLLIRPAATYRWRWLHGGFLLCMVPFGCHWLPQGPVLRAVTGVLFGFGLVSFLQLTIWHLSGSRSLWWYGTGLLMTIIAVPLLGACGGRLAAGMLELLAVGGVLALLGLVLANVVLAACWLIRRTGLRILRVRA